MKQRIGKNKAYRKNMQLIRIMKEKLLAYTSSHKFHQKIRKRKNIIKKVRTTHTNMQKEDSEIMIFTINHYARNS